MDKMKIIYKKDGSGAKITYGESVYNEDVIQHAPVFQHIPTVLNKLENFVARDSDVWLLTYPKAGTHWVHEIINILLADDPEPTKTFKTDSMVERYDFSNIEEMDSPRVINTHIKPKYLPLKSLLKSKVICGIRNPKSVAVSYYHQTKGFTPYEYEGSFSGYLPLYTEGYDNLYGSWFDHVLECWDAFKDKDNVLFVFYEDLKKNPVDGIEAIDKFLGMKKINIEYYQKVAEVTSFDVMSTHAGKDVQAVQKKAKLIKSGFSEFRKGTINDWKNYFTVAENEKFDVIYEEKMKNCPELKAKIKFE